MHLLTWSMASGSCQRSTSHERAAAGTWGLAIFLCSVGATVALAQSGTALGFDPYVTIAGNFDAGYHETQFFEPNHKTAVGQWDTRVEFWLPPFRSKFSWGPYVRATGIAASQSEAWENGWLGGPGAGVQMYPFSLPAWRKRGSTVGKILGPLRLFAEYNRTHYWGQGNQWRPHKQTRIGMEYWRARHVNDGHKAWWETWNGLSWQSANEFDSHYDAWILASAFRGGLRVPGSTLLSALTPYVAAETSLTDQRLNYWENRLLTGGGLRLAPSLTHLQRHHGWFNRFAIYAEYLRAAAYYRQTAPASIPAYDVRIGITASVGQWYQ